MDSDRPFSGPVSVSLAGLTLAGLAAWSFGSGLSRELRLSRAEAPPAHVVVLPPKPAPSTPAPTDLAYMADLPPEPAPPVHHARHRPDAVTAPLSLPAIPPPTPALQAPAADAAASDAAAAAPAQEPAPEPAPTSPAPDGQTP